MYFEMPPRACGCIGVLLMEPLWPLGVHFLLVLLIVGGMLVGSHVLGERHRDAAKNLPYEGGVLSYGSGRLRFSVNFYLIAVFFVIFDLEVVFLFAWAIAAREAGWPGYIEMLIFAGVLAATLAYLWRVGALNLYTGKGHGG
jgi:NADH-quinone oxidoreductase subunit A